MHTFSATGVIKEAWEIFKKRPWFLIWAVVLSGFLVNIASQVVTGVGTEIGDTGTFGAFLINLAINAFYGAGLIAFFVKAYDSIETVKLADLWCPTVFWNYLAATLLITAVVGIGFILLIIPGIIVAIMLYFTTYLVVDQGLGPIEAMKESKRITEGHRWDIAALIGLLILIVIAGVICLFVGIFVAIPVTLLATVAAYRKLEHKKGRVAVEA